MKKSVNDTWSMNILEGKLVFNTKTSVYNRWGKKVFESTDVHQDWNGMEISNGFPCSSGTYFYIISYTDGITNTSKSLRGFLELIR